MARVERSMRNAQLHVHVYMCVCVFKFSSDEQTITMFSTISNILKKDFKCFWKESYFRKYFYSLSYRLWFMFSGHEVKPHPSM